MIETNKLNPNLSHITTTNAPLGTEDDKLSQLANSNKAQLEEIGQQLTSSINALTNDDSIFANRMRSILLLMNNCVAELSILASNTIDSRSIYAQLIQFEIKLVTDAINKIQLLMKQVQNIYAALQEKDARDKSLQDPSNPNVPDNKWANLGEEQLTDTYSDLLANSDIFNYKSDDGKPYSYWKGWNIGRFLSTPMGQFLVKYGYITLGIKGKNEQNACMTSEQLLEKMKNSLNSDKEVDFNEYPDHGLKDVDYTIVATDKLFNNHYKVDVSSMSKEELADWNKVIFNHDKKNVDVLGLGITNVNYTSDSYFTGKINGYMNKNKTISYSYYPSLENPFQLKPENYISISDTAIEGDDTIDSFCKTVYYKSSTGTVITQRIISKEDFNKYINTMISNALALLSQPPAVFSSMGTDVTSSNQNQVKIVADNLKDVVDKNLYPINNQKLDDIKSIQDQIDKIVSNFLSLLRQLFG